jgi:hypothetical protein
MTTSEALAFFKENGYGVIPNALTPDEVAFLNAFVDRDMAAHPEDWRIGQTPVRGHAHPLMENPELDRFVQHPSTFPLMREILGDEIRFGSNPLLGAKTAPAGEPFLTGSNPLLGAKTAPAGEPFLTWQFDFRDVEPGVPDIAGQHRHGDRAFRDPGFPRRHWSEAWDHPAGERPDYDPEHPYECGYLCAIHYLTEVRNCCPCFGIVPGSWRYPTLDEAKARMGDQYREVPIRGPAGTAFIYHIATYHGQMASACTHGRQTLHAYPRRDSRPVLSNWRLIPERLAFHPDPAQRAFYSHWSPAMRNAARWFMSKGGATQD